MTEEESLHLAVCRYIKYQYPEVIFFSDLNGIRLPMGLRMKIKELKSDAGIPDLFIAFPARGHYGLFIELKREGEKLKKRNGEWKSTHIEGQADIHHRLRQAGYYADFFIGFNQAKAIIEWYLNN